ncbi:MAG: P1 family peptidase [Clostridiales Family XIII bacterium]|jgi:L-aminopeptidase/D-esterase-like protein|nr:P1 family peptidase [Clostridiales Family XIII bacterium]
MKEIKINEIEGFKIGSAQDVQAATGCTVILCEEGAVAAVDVRGSAPATRETAILRPVNTMDRIHAVMLSGGSAFGLDAASGAMAYLEERGIGFPMDNLTIPLVCAASLYDLAVGDPFVRPDKAMGYLACQNAGNGPVEEGNAGAGTGASVGKFFGTDRMMKSGLGTCAAQVGSLKCGVIVAVNALGDILDADTGQPVAGILNPEGTALDNTLRLMYEEIDRPRDLFKGNTTIGCVLTNAKLTKTQATALASLTHNGMARTIRPVHTSVDGDSIFIMSYGEEEAAPDALGALAAEMMGRAINRAVRAAKSAYGLICAGDLRQAQVSAKWIEKE